MGSEKKRKVQDASKDVEQAGDRIEPQSMVPSIDTSKWPLLLKVSLHYARSL